MKSIFPAVLISLTVAGTALAQSTPPSAARAAVALNPPPTTTAPATPNDYGQASTWLCRPGVRDACAQDQTTTVITAEGLVTVEPYTPPPNPQIDCFYVYPTVSNDKTPNSDMVADLEETRVIEQQFARFGRVCRQYAPLYRQVTLTALRAGMAGQPMAADRDLAYRDVLQAWRWYLAHDNKGRGVVLIGHSQGSGVLTRLIKEEIDGKPIQKQLVSAILAGTSLPPPGSAAPMAFTSIKPCGSSRQLGCVVAFASFRVDSPPPANSRFGRIQATGESAVCVNPASLRGGEGPLEAYLSSRAAIADSSIPPKPWLAGGAAVTTPFVRVPGLLSAQCVQKDGFNYLAITTHGDPKDPRVDEITGDVVAGGQVLKDWGLHLIDVNLTMGDLLSLVSEETRAYLARK